MAAAATEPAFMQVLLMFLLKCADKELFFLQGSSDRSTDETSGTLAPFGDDILTVCCSHTCTERKTLHLQENQNKPGKEYLHNVQNCLTVGDGAGMVSSSQQERELLLA